MTVKLVLPDQLGEDVIIPAGLGKLMMEKHDAERLQLSIHASGKMLQSCADFVRYFLQTLICDGSCQA